MLSASVIKKVKHLSTKKGRHLAKSFVAEGPKLVESLLKSPYEIRTIFSSKKGGSTPPSPIDLFERTVLVNEKELQRISFLKEAHECLAIVKIPEKQLPLKKLTQAPLVIGLDGVQDPGNLGSLIRTCDWFGISHIICSKDTVDCYNPKVVQATMGSIASVTVLYDELEEVLKSFLGSIYTTSPHHGTSIYEHTKEKTPAFLVLGNEARGVKEAIQQYATTRLSIPKFTQAKAESLNLSVSSAILISQLLGDPATIETST